MTAKKIKYYAYFVPETGARGVTDNWKACERMVKGITGARFKAFDDKKEAEAWIARGARYEPKPPEVRGKLERGIYFDAGTGRGTGVEVSVTDEMGKNLLHKAVVASKLNRFGKHLVGRAQATNNYGELLALRYALEIAKKMPAGRRVKKIFGDSRLVIDYWSRRRIKRKTLPRETVALAAKVAKLREAFEAAGGAIKRISGARNPADLGFHR